MNRQVSRLRKLGWVAKQILPLSYQSEYVKEEKRYFTVWRMWFGMSFNIVTYEIVRRMPA